MLASILKRMARLMGVLPAAGELPAAPPPPLPVAPERVASKTAAPSAHMCRPRVSPLAKPRRPRIGRLPHMLPAIAARLAATAHRRPKAAAPAPKRAPMRRHVWLEPRPASRRATPTRLADRIAWSTMAALPVAA